MPSISTTDPPTAATSQHGCARLGISLLASPARTIHSPRQDGAPSGARCAEGCLDSLPTLLPPTRQRQLWAFLDQHLPRRRALVADGTLAGHPVRDCRSAPPTPIRRDIAPQRPDRAGPPSRPRDSTLPLAVPTGRPTTASSPGVCHGRPAAGRDLRAALDRARGKAAAAPSSRAVATPRRKARCRAPCLATSLPAVAFDPPRRSSIRAVGRSPSDHEGSR